MVQRQQSVSLREKKPQKNEEAKAKVRQNVKADCKKKKTGRFFRRK